MLIIDDNAESALYAVIMATQNSKNDSKARGQHFLQCQFFQVGQKPDASEISTLIKDCLPEKDTSLYVCTDGDIVIKWQSHDTNIQKKVTSTLWKAYKQKIEKYMSAEDFFTCYNNLDSLDSLKLECQKKQRKVTKQTQKLTEHLSNPTLITNFKRVVRGITMQKIFRSSPHILIVDDQIFSQKLLLSILKNYTCFVANTCGEALLTYMEKFPDIVFLDIDLPDISGHNFAKLLSNIDEHSFVVMVSANNYQDDIDKAIANKAKAFIVKPFKKETILDVIEKYKKQKKIAV